MRHEGIWADFSHSNLFQSQKKQKKRQRERMDFFCYLFFLRWSLEQALNIQVFPSAFTRQRKHYFIDFFCVLTHRNEKKKFLKIHTRIIMKIHNNWTHFEINNLKWLFISPIIPIKKTKTRPHHNHKCALLLLKHPEICQFIISQFQMEVV